MNKFLLWTLHWVPRILGIVFILFVSLFAVDVFGEGNSILETLTALVIHLIPSFLLLAALLISWRWSWAGFLFILLGMFFLMLSWADSKPWFTLLILRDRKSVV